MRLTEMQARLVGEWAGSNLLRLSWLTPPEYQSAGHLSVQALANGKFLTCKYTWSHEGKPHAGMILLAHDPSVGLVTAAWVDSWHQSTRIMACQGSIDDAGIIEVRGQYAAPPGPDWGWRITLSTSSENTLQLVMHNCAPDGTEELAVQADYTRVS